MEVNLLPWRELKRAQQKRRFLIQLTGNGILSMFMLFIINFYLSALIEEQMLKNQKINDETCALQKKMNEDESVHLMKKKTGTQLTFINHLQEERKRFLHLINHLPNLVPEEMFLTRVERIAGKITLIGRAKSNHIIAILMRRIAHNAWILNPQLVEVKKLRRESGSEFKLDFYLNRR